MIILRILLGIISIPLLLAAYLFRLLLRIVVGIGNKIIIIIATGVFGIGLFILIVELFGDARENIGMAIGMMVGGVLGYFLPILNVVLATYLDAFIEWVMYNVFGR